MEITARSYTTPNKSKFYVPNQLPLPGVVIFVHGVNSDGEWYEACEEGLCKGLNRRLARTALAYPGVSGGQLTRTTYTPELSSEGFLRRDRNDKTFVDEEKENWSPVIRFRWGFKANLEELREFGANVWLNEDDFWGGGPFANGCSSIADLWGPGLNDRLFLWITAQHLNPVPSRDAYGCPPRAYYVHAALRLAKLIKSIRDKQADCPITLVCHSQGNMVGIGGVFLADTLGVQVDSLVLNNPPYTLVPDKDNAADSWTQRYSADPKGATGRQSDTARTHTLKAFFELLRERAGSEQDPGRIDHHMAHERPRDGSTGYTAEQDRSRHGLNGHTHGRVTLYCNPHDQVISALTVQGIGWRGMSQAEIDATGGAGVFTQRVFAQGFKVGENKPYRYWDDRWNKDLGPGQDGFWNPPSPIAQFSLKQGVESNTSIVGKFFTYLTLPLSIVVSLLREPVNADPPKGWSVPVNAPELDEELRFEPKARRYGQDSDRFDEGYDPSGNARAPKPDERKASGDVYDHHPTQTAPDGSTDAPMGDEATEAQARYEDRARLRMKARRDKLADENHKVIGEDEPDQATPEYKKWREGQVAEFLSQSIDQNATDHSTIVGNAMHSERAMAYDVAIGVCTLTRGDWQQLRIEADWRYSSGLEPSHPHRHLSEYFLKGRMNGKHLHEWIEIEGCEAKMPAKIHDERVWKPADPVDAIDSNRFAPHDKGGPK